MLQAVQLVGDPRHYSQGVEQAVQVWVEGSPYYPEGQLEARTQDPEVAPAVKKYCEGEKHDVQLDYVTLQVLQLYVLDSHKAQVFGVFEVPYRL